MDWGWIGPGLADWSRVALDCWSVHGLVKDCQAAQRLEYDWWIGDVLSNWRLIVGLTLDW